MSTIKSQDEDLTLNAHGSGNDIKFQSNGVEKASISGAGLFTSTTIDATKLTGTIPNFTSTGIDDNADATAMTIDSSENVGIGATSPTNKLHTHGAAGNTYQQFTNNTTGSGTGDGAVIGLAQDDSMLRIENRENSHIRFNTNGSERMRITNDGRGLSQFTAKVWVHIDSGTLADGHNVSSITDNGTGEYQVNFANNLANDNYSSTTSNPYRNGSSRRALVNTYNPNVNNINIAVFEYNHSNSNGFYAYDLDKCTMTIFGD